MVSKVTPSCSPKKSKCTKGVNVSIETANWSSLESELDTELGLELVVHPVEAVHGAHSLGDNLFFGVIGSLARDHSEGCCAPVALLNLEPQVPLGLVELLHASLHQPDQVHRDHNLEAGAVNLPP